MVERYNKNGETMSNYKTMGWTIYIVGFMGAMFALSGITLTEFGLFLIAVSVAMGAYSVLTDPEFRNAGP